MITTVYQLINNNKPVVNQIVIFETGRGVNRVTFQSYETPVCCIDSQHKTITFKEWFPENKNKFWSKTTRKYLYEFLYQQGFGFWDIKTLRTAIADKSFERYHVTWKVKYVF